MSFSEMLEALGVSSSFLTYHLENLGELIGKTDEGRYRLSSFGEAAMSTMTNVEEIPATVLQQSREHLNGKRTNDLAATKIVGRTTAIALGIICIVLVACLAGTVTLLNGANSKISNLQSRITSDNDTINSLNSNVSNLQGKLNSILNASISVGDIIMSEPSAWVNKTVLVEGTIQPLYNYGSWSMPWNYQLSSNRTTIGVFWQGDYGIFKGENAILGVNALVLGIIVGGQETQRLANGTIASIGPVYFLEAETIDTL